MVYARMYLFPVKLQFCQLCQYMAERDYLTLIFWIIRRGIEFLKGNYAPHVSYTQNTKLNENIILKLSKMQFTFLFINFCKI